MNSAIINAMKYSFGGDTGLSPESIKQRRALAMMGSDELPKTIGGGLNSAGQSIAAALMIRKMDQQGDGIGQVRPRARPIPAYRHGTDYHPGGAAIVGEDGPEAVILPPGAKVIPNKKTLQEPLQDERSGPDIDAMLRELERPDIDAMLRELEGEPLNKSDEGKRYGTSLDDVRQELARRRGTKSQALNVYEIQAPDGTIYEVEARSIKEAATTVGNIGQQDKPWYQALKENLLGDNDPNTQNFGEKVGSALNKAGESMTFGLIGDEASAAAESLLPGVDYEGRRDHYRQQEAILERDNPGLALGADIAGALAAPIGSLGFVAKAPGYLNAAKRVAASAAATGVMSGIYGGMEGEGGLESRLRNASGQARTGAAIGAAIPVVGGVAQRLANTAKQSGTLRSMARGAPSTEELRRLGNAAYDAVEDAGVQVKPEAFDRNRKAIIDALRAKTGFDELPGPGSLTPNTARVTQIMGETSEQMAQNPTSALPFRSIDQMRRQAGAAAGNIANKADQRAGMEVIEGLDDFVRNLGPDDVVTGDVDALKTALPKARDVWARMSRSQLIDDAIAQEGNYMSGGASAIRNRFASILRNPKLAGGFSDAEKKVMQKVVSGSLPQQLINYLGSGLGMMGQMGTGAALGGPLGFLAGAGAAAGTRKLSEATTRRNAELARAIIANGGLQKAPKASPEVRRIVELLLQRSAGTAPN